MKKLNLLLAIFTLSAGVLMANDDLSDWVLVPNGDLVFKNDFMQPLTLTYTVPTTAGVKKNSFQVAAKSEESVDISAYSLFRSDLKLFWQNHEILGSARKHLVDQFNKKFNAHMTCEQACCSISCQSEPLIRSFMGQGKILTRELEQFKNALKGTKIILEFSQDRKELRVTTRIGKFSEISRFGS